MPKKYTIYIFILFHKQKKKQFKVYKKMAYLAFVKIYKNSKKITICNGIVKKDGGRVTRWKIKFKKM